MSLTSVPGATTIPTPSPSPIVVELSNQASTAPWWGVPVIAGIFLLAGACLGYVFNRSMDRRRNLREDQIRWHTVVRELAADIVALGDDLAWSGRVLDSLRNDDGDIDDAKLPGYSEQLKRFSEDLQSMFSKANQLNLLVGRDIGDPMFLFTYVSRDASKVPDDDEERKLIRTTHKKFKDDFIAAVRKYLELDTEQTKRAP
ncbi:hypothetical protein [Curtobacterium sp. MCSS17_007]|uniref:hypothetical protein n=1 Tax=Curtobacterium sp. MCSS17_007 TaxID=2175646 RepID=UPI0011B49348|nr:hypothetical protein [Curtobacterium sp. MCSS17_007]WIE74488.1 hypothetical protein DEJ22_009355 [Curtobacterium sp. MCSS17_007]